MSANMKIHYDVVVELTALIVRKGARPKGKKADLVLQVGVLWATK